MRSAFIRFLIFLATGLIAYAVLVSFFTEKGEMGIWWDHPLIWMLTLGISIFSALNADVKDSNNAKK
jgi:hypothetical protein